MKVEPRNADSFAKNPPAEVHAVLVYGPDTGLVRERADHLVRAVLGGEDDPFRLAEFDGKALAEDPARLADEAASMSLTGGRRAVRVRDATDGLGKLFGEFLKNPEGDALIVVEGGDLPARSALRKAFESAKTGAALPCYRDDGRDLAALVREMAQEAGLGVSQDALAHLTSVLGGDRQLTRREMEKLILYKASGTIELEDARACVGDSAALSLEDLAFAVGGGDLAGLERTLNRCLQEGTYPVSILRAVARHMERLNLAAALAAGGENIDQVMTKRLRPPVFWKVKDRFRSQVQDWGRAGPGGFGLPEALDRLLEAEIACKTTGTPDRTMASRTLMEITARAPGRRRRG